MNAILPAFKVFKSHNYLILKILKIKVERSKGYIAQDNVDNFPEAYTTSKFLDDDDTEYLFI